MNQTKKEVSAWDQFTIKQTGDAQDIMLQITGQPIGRNNGEKQLAGIRKYIRYKIEMDKKNLNLPDPSTMDETYYKPDGSQVTKREMFLSEEDSKDPARIMYLMGYDPLQWQLVSCKIKRNYWSVAMKLSQGSDEHGHKAPEIPHKETNHSFLCELTCKPIQNLISSQNIIDIFDNMKPPKLEKYKYAGNSGLMLELPIMDFHLGSLAWKEESGANWNYKKAIRVFKDVILELLARIKQYGLEFEKIIFPIGQDFFHFDTQDFKTVHGTQMETDSRWQKILREGNELLVWAIEQLRAIAPVEVFWIPGNHDTKFSYFAVCYVYGWFRNDSNVKVDLSAEKRKYTHFGKVGIGFSHGEQEGKRIEDSMQVEEPKLWGKTLFREFHLGHIHHEKVIEVGGITIRNISALTATDLWHKDKAFVGSIRKLQGIVWDREKGKQLTIDVNVVLS